MSTGNEQKGNDDPKKRKLMAIIVALILLGTLIGALLWMSPSQAVKSYETGEATFDDLLNSKSEIVPATEPIVASDSDPNYALIATPVALYYEGAERHVQPLLVFQGSYDRYKMNGASSAVNRFFVAYPTNQSTVTIIGDVVTSELVKDVSTTFQGSPEEVSLDVAQHYWTASDGVILVSNDFDGYAQAVNAVPLASYLGIPVVVMDGVTEDSAAIFEGLGVKYSIVCGDISGYNKVMRFKEVEEINDIVLQTITERIQAAPRYIALGNPLDAIDRVVLNSTTVLDVEEIIQDSGATAYPGAAPSGIDGPTFNFSIPYKYCNLKIDVKMDVSEAGQTPWWGEFVRRFGIEDNADGSGERIYIYMGIDMDGNGELDSEHGSKELQFFGGSPGYDFIRENPNDPTSKPLWAHFYIELPYVNEPIPEHLVQLLGRLPTDPDISAPVKVKIVAEELAEPVFPLMPGLSSMAPYLAAYRMGIVLAKEDFQLHSPGYIGCSSCGIPAANDNVTETANEETFVVKKDIDELLGKIAGLPWKSAEDKKALAEHYASLGPDEIVYLGIIADTNMIPQYYYPSTGQGDATEGFGIPSDIIYQDIDVDREDVPYALLDGAEPSFEIPAGRISGWDVQDSSALLARTFFYHDIISVYQGPLNTQAPGYGNMAEFWRDSGVTTLGSEPPIGSAYPTTDKIKAMYQATGMTTNPTRNPYNLKYESSRRQVSQPYYESANMLFFCAHGFYYWYVPTAWESHFGVTSSVYAGGAFDIIHVKDMSFGPGNIFGSSCVTGRIDGIPGRNALALAFLHGGLNSYVGATRSSWGSLVPIPDESSGESLGDLLALYYYAGLTGYIYNKDTGLVDGWEYSDLTIGYSLMLAKNLYIEDEGGYDSGGTTADTFEEFILHGDPMFNPYTPDHPDTPS